MNPAQLRQRTATFAREVDTFVAPLLEKIRTRNTAEQLLEASASVASNYRAAGRARSHAEFTAKIGTVLEEADESQFWLQHLDACRLADQARLAPLLAEATELVAIFTTAVKTAQATESDRRQNPPRPSRRRG